jgi:type III secretory pathway lipoprotein EscJ
MQTNNNEYCRNTEQWLNNIIKKSTLVSGTSEKQRLQLFQAINKQIDDLMKRISDG